MNEWTDEGIRPMDEWCSHCHATHDHKLSTQARARSVFPTVPEGGQASGKR